MLTALFFFFFFSYLLSYGALPRKERHFNQRSVSGLFCRRGRRKWWKCQQWERPAHCQDDRSEHAWAGAMDILYAYSHRMVPFTEGLGYIFLEIALRMLISFVCMLNHIPKCSPPDHALR